MRTLPAVVSALAAFTLVAGHQTASAQSPAQLKKELRTREKAAAKDPAVLLELAQWAKDKGLVDERQRLLNSVLKIDPGNATANGLLGYVEHDGKWVTKAKAEILRRQALDAAMKAKGMVEVDGVWVGKDEVADAKKGIFRFGGEPVSKVDKLALEAGQVRHPRTGEFIDADDLEKAEGGLFPIGDGKWGTEDEANSYHSGPSHPWVMRTNYCTVVSSRSLSDLSDLATTIDSAYESAAAALGDVQPTPDHRPVLVFATDTEQYRMFGDDRGAEGSAYAVFISTEQVDIDGLGSVRPIYSNYDKNWSPYWARHAAGLAYIVAIATDLESDIPTWFARGMGGLCERAYNPGIAKHFGDQHMKKGGIDKDLAAWISGFKISSDSSIDLDAMVYQAGLLMSFALEGGDEEATAALNKVQEAAAAGDGKAFAKAVEKFGKVLGSKTDEVRAYFAKILLG